MHGGSSILEPGPVCSVKLESSSLQHFFFLKDFATCNEAIFNPLDMNACDLRQVLIVLTQLGIQRLR